MNKDKSIRLKKENKKEGVVGEKWDITGNSSLLPLIFKKIGNMPLFANYIAACPYFDTQLP